MARGCQQQRTSVETLACGPAAACQTAGRKETCMAAPHTPPPHDVGGRHHAPIVQEEHDYAHWEKEADAIRMLLADSRRRLFTTDESRRVQEQLDDATYWKTP
jgi:hypothetical protein